MTWGGAATAGDYTVSVAGGSLGGSVLTIAAGSPSATVTITPVDDTTVEGSETVTLTIVSGSGYTVGSPASASGTIADNDTVALPSLSIQATASVTEGSRKTTTVTLTVTLSRASTQTVTVGYATGNGTATSGSDYVAKSGTLTFSAGVLTQTITLTVNGDTTAEPDETFTVTLSNPTNATIAGAIGTVTIVNDDGAAAPATVIGSAPRAGSEATPIGDIPVAVAVESSGRSIASGRATPMEPAAAARGTRVDPPGQNALAAPVAIGPGTPVVSSASPAVLLDLLALLGTALALLVLAALIRGLSPALSPRRAVLGG